MMACCALVMVAQFSIVQFAVSDKREPWLRTSDFGLRTSDFGLRTSDFGLRTSDFGGPVLRKKL
ncbi:MAG: hypothetical protein FWD57_07955 [Polyangiaceae bacterium]|nr:hypothetical protein [Polyangiaceae bacterium]